MRKSLVELYFHREYDIAFIAFRIHDCEEETFLFLLGNSIVGFTIFFCI